LSILFLNFWQVLKLDSLPLENSSLHILDHLLLLLSQLFISEFHSMDFLLHCDYFTLADVGIESILHLLFKLDFSFPEENLTLSFNYLCKDICLLFFETGDGVL